MWAQLSCVLGLRVSQEAAVKVMAGLHSSDGSSGAGSISRLTQRLSARLGPVQAVGLRALR